MIGELIAYYLGRSAGRSEQRGRRFSRPTTTRDVIEMRICAIALLLCCVIAVLVSI